MISDNGRQGDNPADARPWVSVSEAAQATKRSMRQVRNWITEGKVRADQNLMELPVVLVTSLESREDHERGAEVGANAYLVKRGFDQANLLEVIRRLI